MNINTLDIILFFLLLFLFVRGVIAGVWRTLFSLLALILSFYAAAFYYDKVWDLLTHLAPTLKFSSLIAFLSVLIAVYIAARILSVSITRPINANYFGKWDKPLGGLLGIGKGLIVTTFLILTLIKFLSVDHALLQTCRIKSYCLSMCRAAALLTPSKFRQDVAQKICSPPGSDAAAPRSSPQTGGR
jgi:membrane protein required for colicin V production